MEQETTLAGRIRTIKPEWLEDERMVMASNAARVLSIALILEADDYGNGRANDVLLGGRIFPTNPHESPGALRELRDMGFLTLYRVRGQRYFAITNWDKHQKVSKPGKPRVPQLCDADSIDSENAHESPGDFSKTHADHDHDHDHDPSQKPPDSAGASSSSRPRKAKKKPPPPDGYQEFIDSFTAAFELANNCRPTWGARQGAQVKNLLKAHGLDECLRRMDVMFTSPPPWMATRDLGTLQAHFDKLAQPHRERKTSRGLSPAEIIAFGRGQQ